MDTERFSVWDKINLEEYAKGRQAAVAASHSGNTASGSEMSRWDAIRNRLFWATLNLVAAMFWIYIPIKLFVGDIDHWSISRISPSLLWILDYRFVFVIAALTLIMVFAKRWKIVVIPLYILFFPAVALFWRIPRLYYRTGNWNLVIGTIQVLWSLGKSVRFLLVFATIVSLAAVVVALDGPGWLLWPAAVILLILWGWLLARAFRYAITPSNFVEYHQKILSAILDSSAIWRFFALPDGVKDASITRLDDQEVTQVITAATMGLALYSGGALWADRLDRYRKSGVSVIFSALAVVSLVAQAVMIFTLVNMAIYRVNGSEFAYQTHPRLLTFVRYTFFSMYASEIEALRPVGDAANLVSVLSLFSVAVILIVLVVSLVFSTKQSRDDRVAEESIQAMRLRAGAFADKLAGEYSLPLRELIDRVAELGGFLGTLVRQMSEIAGVIQRQGKE